MARGKDQPLRLIQGDSTRLADPHGIAVDAGNVGCLSRTWLDAPRAAGCRRIAPVKRKRTGRSTRSYAVPGSAANRGRRPSPSTRVYAPRRRAAAARHPGSQSDAPELARDAVSGRAADGELYRRQ